MSPFVGGGSAVANGSVTISMTPFPSRTTYWLHLGWLVASFFALSAIFQLAVCFAGEKTAHLYNDMFGINKVGKNQVAPASDDSDEDQALVTQDNDENQQTQRPDVKVLHCRGVLTINWLRYVEYSVSASVMMLCIALVSGILDLHLLMCIFFLTFACMLLGYGAEILLRISQVLEEPLSKNVEVFA